MNEILNGLLGGFATAATPTNLLYCLIGVVLGTLAGILPGFGPSSAIAVLLPIAYGMDPAPAVIMLSGIYIGAQYAGSTTAILLGIPGEPSSAMTAIDGMALSKAGKAGKALGIAAIGSFVAGTVALIGLTFLAPPLGHFAMKIQPPELFAIVFVALLSVAAISGDSLVKGVAMAAFGILVSLVGIDSLTGVPRLTFGSAHLLGGIDIIILALALFAIREVVDSISESTPDSGKLASTRYGSLYPSRREIADCAPAIARGSLVGFAMGVLPGAGATTASFISYGLEKSVGKDRARIGKGSLSGVAAPESANNAASTGSFIPMLSLGIPGSGTTALLLGAFILVGVRPGPLLFTESPDVAWALIASFYLANVALLVLNLPLVGLFVQVIKTPYSVLSLIIVVSTIIGAYAIQYATADVWLLIGFGVAAYFLSRAGYPMAPLLLGAVLGRMIEQSFRQSMALSGGSLTIFFHRPIALVCLVIAVVLVAVVAVKTVRGRTRVLAGLDE